MERSVGARLAAFRATKGLSLSELARVSGVSQPYLTYLESGDRQNPSLTILTKLAKALAVPTRDLLG